jgi:hypothetical protein
MVRNWIDTLPGKTGKSLDQWVALVKSEGPKAEKERLAWLKNEHKLGTNAASWIAERCEGKGVSTEVEDPETYRANASAWVDAMFSGKRAALRPVYERLLKVGRGLGGDVRVCPCQTIVPFYRRHVFAQVKPTTNTRIDLGFALGDTPASGRLIDTGGFAKKDRITHRIPLSRVDEIDDGVLHWFKTAYARDSGG